jgi:hypothetical protein
MSSSAGLNRPMKMPADVVHVLGRCDLDGAAPGRQETDDDAAGIGGIGFTADQPEVNRAPDLVGEPDLLPPQRDIQFLRVLEGPPGAVLAGRASSVPSACAHS